MSLPTPTVSRTLKHTRTVVSKGFEREDGLWDIELMLTDVKTREIPMATKMLAPGEPIHELWLRVTLDTKLNVVDASASSDAVPYPGMCDTIAPAYQVLKGLNLLHGFKAAVKARLSGTAGCTHITELCNFLPTAAIQTFAGDVLNTREGELDASGTLQQPFQLDRCHALRVDGDAVKTFYPAWFRPSRTDN